MSYSSSSEYSFPCDETRLLNDPLDEASGTRNLKIMMLHEHGSSGSNFDAKTSHIQKRVREVARETTHQEVEFHFPDAPYNLDDAPTDMQTWGVGDYRSTHAPVTNLDKSMQALIDYMEKQGPFDGAIGFSAGSCVAVALASLLEDPYRSKEIPITTSHPPLRFVVAYSSFMLGHECYDSLYAPQIQTPIMLFMGEMDTFIPNDWTRALEDHCANSLLIKFGGMHYVPRISECTEDAAQFIFRALTNKPLIPKEDHPSEWETASCGESTDGGHRSGSAYT